MTSRQRIRFYQQLAVLVRAGVPMRTSLDRLRDRFPGRELEQLSSRLNSGEGIGDAFVGAGFSPFECHLITAGERSARLETVFEHLAEYWSRRSEMVSALMRPLYYPLAVLHLAILVGALVQWIFVSWVAVLIHFVAWLALAYVVGFGLVFVVRLSWSSAAAQRFWLFLPLIGRTLSSAYAYRWITALRIEHSAGVPMPDAVADAWRASGFVDGDELAREGEEALREGAPLSRLVQRWRRLPSDWVDFIETGEISGALEKAFENLEAEAGRNWLRAEQRMNDWLPKIVYFVILLVVAGVVASLMYQVVIAPINNMNKVIGGGL